MSAVSGVKTGRGASLGGLGRLAAATLAVAALGVLPACQKSASQTNGATLGGPAHDGPLAKLAKGSMAKLSTWSAPRPGPTASFNDRDGKPVNLSQFRGKVVVMNVWATWCAPCRIEMPTLAALQRKYAGTDLVVLPVSVDKADRVADARNFIDVHSPLPLFNDPAFALASSLRLKGMPSTVIYDRQGREVARLEGETDWNTPEAWAVADALLKQR
ncbi:MAG: TlpA family protein disulfide reductase [Proteobacteria bacterium]|nr:TlpA family protein disulfide reductase [Pseudomonadota bacterium]